MIAPTAALRLVMVALVLVEVQVLIVAFWL